MTNRTRSTLVMVVAGVAALSACGSTSSPSTGDPGTQVSTTTAAGAGSRGY